MKNFKKILKIIISLVLVICFLGGCNTKSTNYIFNNTNSSIKSYINQNTDSSSILIHFIDVGQGDCILIQVNNKNMLIDAGSNGVHSKVISYLKNTGIKKINYFIITHPHEDHVGGASDVIDTFNIQKLYAPKKISNIDAFKKMILSLKKRNKKINIAKAGVSLDMGKNTICEIIAPNNKSYESTNNYSSVIKLVYKNNKFLFLGDAEELSENEILNTKYDISSDVIKIGHHGSKTSTSTSFLNKVKPKIAIISCGKNNDYNHPNTEIINRLKKVFCKIYRTDVHGDIILIGNGKDLKILTKK